jgi:hypothetical protein
MDLPHVAVAACTVTGDIARISRNEIEGTGDRAGLSRELGNLILPASAGPPTSASTRPNASRTPKPLSADTSAP